MVTNSLVGVYIPMIRIPIKGGMTIPNIRSLDPDTHVWGVIVVKQHTSYYLKQQENDSYHLTDSLGILL